MTRSLITALLSILLVVVSGSGAARETVPVPHSTAEQLCARVNCFHGGAGAATVAAPAPANPQITSVFGTVTPGGKILIVGTGFGSSSGKAELAWPGRAPTRLPVDSWGDTHVYATVPADITGIGDIDARLHVNTATGNRDSNLFPVRFIAAREVRALDSKSVAVVSCTDADHRNVCKTGYVTTIHSYHRGWLLGSRGTDVYTIGLKNNWVLKEVRHKHVVSEVAGNEIGWIKAVKGLQPGAATGTLAVDWEYIPGGDVMYYVTVFIEGPKGVPHV